MSAYQAIPREQILAAIAKLGPAQPLDIKREVGGDTVLIGAILSEMASNGKVAISKTKRGGSPFYYDPAHPESLENVSQFLPEKDNRTYTLLKEQQVLFEDELDPLTRVSLQNIPDFSRKFMHGERGAWRYFLLSEDEARARITPAPEPAKLEASTPAAQHDAAPVPQESVEEKPKSTKKPRKKRAKKALVAQEESQETLAPADDPLLTRAQQFLHNGLIEPKVRKPGVEIVGTHTSQGPFGQVTTMVAISGKKITEKMALAWLLEARGKGMPLLLLTTEEVSKKLEELIEDTPNVALRGL